MKRGIILMIGLRSVEGLQRLHLGHNLAREGMRLPEFGDRGLGGVLLRAARGENLGICNRRPYEICCGSKVISTASACPVRPELTCS